MRVFYVAMTRAEERLFLIGCISRNKDTSLGRSSALLRYAHREQSEKLPAWLIYKAKSYLDFCLLGLARNGNLPMNQLLSDGEEFPPEQNVSPAVLEGRTKAVALSIMSEQEVLESYLTSLLPGEAADAAQNQVPDASSIPLSEEDKLLFEKQIAGVYPFEALTRVPSKMTVSEIKRLAADFEREEDSETGVFLLPGSVSGNRPVNLVPQSIEAKSQQKSRKLSPTERGTLLHSIFQYLDFTSLTFDAGHDRVQRAMEDLLKHKMIREEMAGELGAFYQSIEKFVGSDVCERLVGAEKQKGRGPFREIPFSITKPVGKTDVSLIQGMIDCWFIEEDGAVLIDYKSDVIPGTKADKARVLHERYAIQLDYYARAIEAASGLTVKERIIWLIPDGFSFLIEAPGKTK